jgi:hypothetical protein
MTGTLTNAPVSSLGSRPGIGNLNEAFLSVPFGVRRTRDLNCKAELAIAAAVNDIQDSA